MSVHDPTVQKQVKELIGAKDDEPIFIIRGQDTLAVPVLEFYFAAADHRAARLRISTEFRLAIGAVVERFRLWQKENAVRVKVPD